MGVLAMEQFKGLAVSVANAVLRSVSMVYLNSLNTIIKIEAERNFYDHNFDGLPVWNPVYLVKLLAVDFFYIVKKHKPCILHRFPENYLTKITEEHQ